MLATNAMSLTSFPARVLVADEDAATGELLTSIAEQEGYDLISVSDGRDAYRILKADVNFQAAVFNMTMPHLDGIDIVRFMKTEKRMMRIPVVLVAGEPGLKDIVNSFAAGAVAFLPKPFTTEQLQRTLRIALSSRGQQTIVSSGRTDSSSRRGILVGQTRHPLLAI